MIVAGDNCALHTLINLTTVNPASKRWGGGSNLTATRDDLEVVVLVVLTCDVPAMSTPASRKLLKSCPNLLVALARSWVVPLDAWTTSLADWFRPAATSFS